jgi:choline-sulfatase
VRAARRAYFGAVSYVDDQIGVLLGALADAGFAGDTVVLLLADHGDMLGERGLWYKMNFFEPACRIPFIVHAPQRFAARRVRESASLVDVLPTLIELSGGGSPTARRRSMAGASRRSSRARRARTR